MADRTASLRLHRYNIEVDPIAGDTYLRSA
jgi:hypothetical protein